MKDFRFEQTGGIGLLHFSGELTVEDTEKLRQCFMVSFKSADYVVVNFANVTGFDSGCFKFFCSAYRIFMNYNKRLFLVGLGPKVFRGDNAGGRPEHHSHCVSECHDGCLWRG
jgi:anti-anti-sigma factor